jgi:uncharacterized protein (TIGR00369 family)
MTTTTNERRSGPFWDAAAGRAPLPRAAATLGFELVDADVDRGTLEAAFTATEDFTTPLGTVLGGFLAAMLYDTVGPTVLATLAPDQFISTLDLTTAFLRETGPGRLVGYGRIVRRSGDIAVVDALLTDDADEVVATATAVVQVVDLAAARASWRRRAATA